MAVDSTPTKGLFIFSDVFAAKSSVVSVAASGSSSMAPVATVLVVALEFPAVGSVESELAARSLCLSALEALRTSWHFLHWSYLNKQY